MLDSESLPNEMARYYDARASQYDASMQYDNPEVVARHRAVIDQLKLWFADRTVLEIACGPGFWTSHFAPVTRHVLATDVNESTLAEARKKIYPSGRVEFRVGDAYALDGLSGTRFDAAFAGDWWSHIPKSRVHDFLSALTRCLAPGARVAFTDQLPNERSYRDGSYFDTEGNHIQRRALSGGDSAHYEVIKNFPTESDLCGAVAPFANPAPGSILYQTFPECRRWLLCFAL
ncbi:MAG: class I SAM-dependent methyltransferase [Candidatus Methylacidiphilales bacterium]|nr:methyltransferase domain-containing protein [Candidatus Methylacidiphilales bacterium]